MRKHLKNAFRKAKDSNKSGRNRISCPFCEELDRVLGDQPSLCPGGDVLDSELNNQEPLFNSMMDATIDVAVMMDNSTSAETEGDDGNSDDTAGPDAAATSSSSSLSSQSSSSSSSSPSSSSLK
ncbi:uncharacterized protein DDB_G0271670-like isoform X2 [Thunnus maccoyii]|uniref:uncharacterized protein DDB_G0271670-like isoform X2 n=1 Tax=Thunnus maccoyii TaxID=8240 RepID=UPI001C4A7C48|nr:uncharacterized protein DDB_G0271670-like isoform X2 [Thunnus maccoyii]